MNMPNRIESQRAGNFLITTTPDMATTVTVNFGGHKVSAIAQAPKHLTAQEMSDDTSKLIKKYQVTIMDRVKFFFKQLGMKSLKMAFAEAKSMTAETKISMKLASLKDAFISADKAVTSKVVQSNACLNQDQDDMVTLDPHVRDALIEQLDVALMQRKGTSEQSEQMQDYVNALRDERRASEQTQDVRNEVTTLCRAIGIADSQVYFYISQL